MRCCSHRLHTVAESSGLVLEISPTGAVQGILATPPPLYRDYEVFSSTTLENKSEETSIPASLIPCISPTSLLTHQYDGLTVSLFWSHAHNQWIISTRNYIIADRAYSAELCSSSYPIRRRLYKHSPWRLPTYVMYQAPTFQGNVFDEFWDTWDNTLGFPRLPSWDVLKERIERPNTSLSHPRPHNSELSSATFTFKLITQNTARVVSIESESSHDLVLTAVRLAYTRTRRLCSVPSFLLTST